MGGPGNPFVAAGRSRAVDERLLLAGAVLAAASFGVHWAGWSASLWAWGIPFALILLFLGVVGEAPGAHTAHLLATANTEGHPSERTDK